MRYAAPISTRGYRAVVALAALLGSVAACNDAATAPAVSSATPVDAPQAMILPQLGATATVAIVDKASVVIPEKLSVKFYLAGSATDTVTVFDNSAADKDLAIGRFKVTVPARSWYKVCAQGLSANYGTDYYLDACKTITTNALTFDVGAVVAHRRPKVVFKLVSSTGAMISGGAEQFTYAPGVTSKFNDQFSPGMIVAVLPQPQTYSYCEVMAPAGYAFTSPQCGSITVAWDAVYSKTLVHYPNS